MNLRSLAGASMLAVLPAVGIAMAKDVHAPEAVRPADPCPPPVVQRVHGPTGGGMAAEAALNTTVDLDRHSVRFVEFLPTGRGAGAVGDEYTLAAEQTRESVNLTLTDPRGRLVAGTSAPLGGRSEAEAGGEAARSLSPLLPKIREHQRRVREEERSAISARIRVSPSDAVVQRDERLELALELIDCDDTPLARAPVEFEHSGVGRVEPASVRTDDAGRAVFSFESGQTGSATVAGHWRHENTEGVPVVALPELPAAIRVEEGRWGLTASIRAEGDMTTVGEWDGTFRLVEGDRIEGDGTITTTVRGSCVSGVKRVPMRITGHREDDLLYVTVVGEDDGSEPDTTQDESLGCVIRTLVEMPSFLAGMARFGEMIVMNEPCPIRVPAGAVGRVSAECSGVTFHVTPGGH